MKIFIDLGICFLILATTTSLIYTLDPTGQGFGSALIPTLKYLPYIFSLISVFFLSISIKIRTDLNTIFLFFFIMFTFTGSLYSFIFTNRPIEDTFLGRALGGCVFFACYYICFNERAISLFIRLYVKMILIFSFMMALILYGHYFGFLYPELTQMYHAEMSIIVASAFIIPILDIKETLKKYAFILLILAGFFDTKTTSVIVSLIAIACFFTIKTFEFNSKIKSLSKRIKMVWTVLVYKNIVISSVVICLLSLKIINLRLDERENEVREITMLTRWLEFLDNPIFGTAFTGSPLIEIGTLIIPSHSDLLDLLAFGGLITVVTFVYPISKVVISILINNSEDRLIIWLVLVLMLILLTMVVNPILSTPRMGFFFFSTIGLLFGFVSRGYKTNSFMKITM